MTRRRGTFTETATFRTYVIDPEVSSSWSLAVPPSDELPLAHAYKQESQPEHEARERQISSGR
jgi:hypothetical protein